jgi:hypothetical protein
MIAIDEEGFGGVEQYLSRLFGVVTAAARSAPGSSLCCRQSPVLGERDLLVLSSMQAAHRIKETL